MTWEPGQYFLSDEPVIINLGKPSIELNVWNVGDRAIQVGSHFHFFEVNKALEFNRGAALGMRLDIPAGTAVRFEPGDRKNVVLVALAGSRRVTGLNWLTGGNVDSPSVRERAVRRMNQRGFCNRPAREGSDG